MKSGKCLNVIIYYNNYQEILDYLKDVQNNNSQDVEFAIVVNSDTEKQINKLKSYLELKNYYSVYFFDFGENVGYLNALLYVIERVDISKYKYFILSNTDIHYVSYDFYGKLLESKYQNDIGCIAPSVYATKSNSYSNPHYVKRIDKEKLKRLSFIFRYPQIAKVYLYLGEYKARRNKSQKKNSCFVYSPHGCFMIFSQDFIARILGYKYGVCLYSEESCVGELLIRNDYRCFYDSSLEVQHQESAVTGRINYKHRFAMWRESIEYILKEFYR